MVTQFKLRKNEYSYEAAKADKEADDVGAFPRKC
jgi:hypothetical protein